jgi:hypothetical protein
MRADSDAMAHLLKLARGGGLRVVDTLNDAPR